MRKAAWVVSATIVISLMFMPSVQAGKSGIWKPADDSNSFYIQTYSTGSCVVIVSPNGEDFYVFLEGQCEDRVNALELFGRQASLDLTFSSDDTAAADLVIGTQSTQYALDRTFEGDCRGDVQGIKPLTNSLGMTFAYIPPGRFTMGSPESEPGRADIENQHLVTLTKGFYMQTTEVTQGQWVAVMGSNPSGFAECGDDCPVETVSWDDAQEFIVQLNAMGDGTYRLPTEAEWEYAARAGSDLAFTNGDIGDATAHTCDLDPNLDEVGWYCGNSGDSTHPVAQKDSNPWGLYDMHGNVWEWVQDRYGEKYPTGSVTDPTGPSAGDLRVYRSGSWLQVPAASRSAARKYDSPEYHRTNNLGFRVVRSYP